MVNTFGTGCAEDERIERAVLNVFRFKPAEIIKDLKLLRPIYEKTSAYGHFGRARDLNSFTWERTDRIGALKEAM